MSYRIIIETNPANPVNYLACCGIFDIVSRFDSAALASWHSARLPSQFVIQSSVSEADFLASLEETLTRPERWEFVRWNNGSEPVVISVVFKSPIGEDVKIQLDWWYETVNPNGGIATKTAWKMYAGNMKVEKTVKDVSAAAAAIVAGNRNGALLSHLLAASYGLTGRFGFDFRSSRDGLDLGFIANDLSTHEKTTQTFAVAEILGLFGVQSFFPSRMRQSGGFDSTRGWTIRTGEDGFSAAFQYVLWSEPLTISLARIAALQGTRLGDPILRAQRKKRGELANLMPAELYNTVSQK